MLNINVVTVRALRTLTGIVALVGCSFALSAIWRFYLGVTLEVGLRLGLAACLPLAVLILRDKKTVNEAGTEPLAIIPVVVGTLGVFA